MELEPLVQAKMPGSPPGGWLKGCPFGLLGVIVLLMWAQAGCDAFARATPTPLPTVVLDSGGVAPQAGFPGSAAGQGEVRASGVVAPAAQAQIASPAGGYVEALSVSAGERVESGQVLARLAGREKLVATIAAANVELLSAQQARAALEKDLDVKQAAALKALADSQEALRAAERRLANLHAAAPDVDIAAAFANLILAQDQLERAQDNFAPYENKPENNLQRAALLSQLAQAQKNYDALLRRYNNLVSSQPNQTDLAQAQADVAVAEAQLAKAQRDYELLQQGPDPDAIALAEARIQNAQAQIAASQAALVDLELKAPFGGTISQLNVHSGEWALPGQALMTLVDLEHLRVETTDLSERDITRVQIGQPVTVFIEALNLEVGGSVGSIAPLADSLGGDVVYQTIIELSELPPALRAGMSVEVQFQTGS
jgi:HlyD family secretion protein